MEQIIPEAKKSRVKQLLRKMINIYSPSGKEGDLVEFLDGYLRRHHLPVMKQKVDDDRYNLIVEPDDQEPQLVFVGHIDTVEAFDLDQYTFEQEGDTIYGLGAADMKGGCAAMIEAFIALWEAGYKDLPIALALVVGEEVTGDGTRRLVKEFQYKTAVVGEPTSLQPCLAHYGYLEFQLNTIGKRMHASMGSKKSSAVRAMLMLLMKVTEFLDHSRPEAIYNIRNLSSSESGFAVADSCESWVDVHLPPRSPLGEISHELEELVSAAGETGECDEVTVKFHTFDAGYEIPLRGSLVKKLEKVYAAREMEMKPDSFRSHSDANLLWSAGIRPIVLGPGSLDKAHTSNECVSFDEVMKAARLYIDIALSFYKQA